VTGGLIDQFLVPHPFRNDGWLHLAHRPSAMSH